MEIKLMVELVTGFTQHGCRCARDLRTDTVPWQQDNGLLHRQPRLENASEKSYAALWCSRQSRFRRSFARETLHFLIRECHARLCVSPQSGGGCSTGRHGTGARPSAAPHDLVRNGHQIALPNLLGLVSQRSHATIALREIRIARLITQIAQTRT